MPFQHCLAIQSTVQRVGSGIDERPIANSIIAGVGVNRKGKLDRAGLRYRRQAAAVNRGDAARIEGGIFDPTLIFEKIRPSEIWQGYRGR
jgi:ribosomal protein L19